MASTAIEELAFVAHMAHVEVRERGSEAIMMLPLLLIAAAGAAVDTPAPSYGLNAAHSNAYNGVIYSPTSRSIGALKARNGRLAALRAEALRMQAADGGTLTPDHRAALQKSLDRIQLRFAELRRRADPYSVDASGHAVYSASARPRVVTPPTITAEPVAY